MRIAKPLLLIITPLGVAGGLYEAYRFAGGLAFLMAMLITVIGVAMCSVVLTIRREQREEEARNKSDATESPKKDGTQ